MGGLLTGIMQSGQAVKRALRGLLDDPRGTLDATADRNIQAYTNPIAQRLGLRAKSNPLTFAPQDQMAADFMGAGVMPMGMLAHTVYHGSPHKFSKFDMSKIGTGEGAQVYGHGLYFAEAPDVARSYKETLENGSPNWSFKTGLGETGTSGDDFVAADIAHMMQKYGPVEKDWLGRELGARGLHPSMAKKVKKYLDAGQIERVKGGAFYKVDIPDEAIPRMLDWDKPLSEQAQEVQAAARQALIATGKIPKTYAGYSLTPEQAADMHMGITGQELIRNFLDTTKKPNAAGASEILKQQGIPGIRYLDGGSRGAGQGSSNFVLFDDNMPRILEINGQPTGLKPWADDMPRKK